MMKKTRKIVIASLSAAFALSLVGAVATDNVAYAQDGTAHLEMIGASIRVDEQAGIRFTAKLNGEVKENVTYHVMIVPYTWVDDYDLSENNDFYKDFTDAGKVPGESLMVMESKPFVDDGVTVVRGSISTVLYGNINRQFFGVAYTEDAEGNREYADNQEMGIRSCTYVAGSALNDDEYVAENPSAVPILNATVNKAYNKVVLGKNSEDEVDENAFGTITLAANGGYNRLGDEVTLLGGTYDTKLDLPVEWTEPTGKQSYLDTANNTLFVLDEEGTYNLSAKVAGQKLSAQIPCGEPTPIMLEDFSSEASVTANLLGANYFGTPGTTIAPSYNATKADKNGVTEEGVGQASIYGSTVVFRFSKTYEELKDVFENIYSLNIRILIYDENVSSGSFAPAFFGVEKSVPNNEWTTVTLTREELFRAALISEFGSEESLINFQAGYNSSDKGHTYCGYAYGLRDTGRGMIRYYDTATSKAGTAYKAISLRDANTAKRTQICIADITYTTMDMLPKAALSLESFTTNADNIAQKAHFDTATNNTTTFDGVYHKSYTDKNGVTEYGVGQSEYTYTIGNVALRFAKSSTELANILTNMKDISFRILATDKDVGENGKITLTLFGVDFEVENNVWVTITLTKEQVFAMASDFTSVEEAITYSQDRTHSGYAAAFAQDGIGYVRKTAVNKILKVKSTINGNSDTNNTIVYIDDITYTLAD